LFYFIFFICHKERNCLKNKERWGKKRLKKGKIVHCGKMMLRGK
jgi:hypothetical protein